MGRERLNKQYNEIFYSLSGSEVIGKKQMIWTGENCCINNRESQLTVGRASVEKLSLQDSNKTAGGC
jgi:hypothetical protein